MGMVDGRVALVTGASRGIGRAISLTLAAEGAAVAVNFNRDAEAAAATVAEIRAAGGRAQAYQASVDDAAAVRAMVEQVTGDLGVVDICINNAGIASRGRLVTDTEPAEVERLLRIHAIGPHMVSAAVLPGMRTRPRGDIVMISSTATRGNKGGGAPYNMAKAAMESLAFTLAAEERPHGVRVNVVAPTITESDMGNRLAKAMGADDIRDLDARAPFGRVCQPEDVAKVVLFCCSDLAWYLTAQRLYVDGGNDLGSF